MAECSPHPGNPLPGCHYCRTGTEPSSTSPNEVPGAVMTALTAERLSAALEEGRRIADGLQFACRDPERSPDFFACGGPAAERYWEHFNPARISALLAALDAALKLADGWAREAVRLDRLADQATGTDPTALAIRRTALGHRAQVHTDFGRELREVIIREMPGQVRRDG